MKHPLRRRWILIAFLGLRAAIRWLPLTAAQALGRLVGYVAYAALGRQRSLSWAHLRQALGPRASARTCHRVVRGVFINLGKTAMEWLVLERLSPAAIRRRVDVHGLQHLHRALAKGRGVIALSAHFGNWELLAIALASLGFKGGVLARPLRYPEYERFLWTLRKRKGVETIARGSLKEVAQLLRANQIIGMMPDQDIDSLEGVFVDFFNRPTYTPVGPAALAVMTGAPILPCFIMRVGRRFRVVIEEPIPITRSDDRKQDLIEITQAWSRVVESYIRRCPDHWVWMHRRWKTNPSRQQTAGSRQSVEEAVETSPTRSFAGLAVCVALAAMLSGCTHQGASPKSQARAEQLQESAATEAVPTRTMDTFTMDGYDDNGTKRWELEGKGATAEASIVTIQQPHVTGYHLADTSHSGSARTSNANPGPTMYLTASLGHIDQNTHRVRLEHDVIVHTSDGLWLTSPEMFWLQERDEAVTDQPVRIETDHMLVYGRGGTGQAKLKTAVLIRDIEMVLNPSSQESPGAVSHVTITCDGPLSFDYERGIAIFEQNVHVVDAQGDLYSDRLIAYVDQTSRTMRYAEAIGRVRIVQGAHTATSDRAIYEPALKKVTLLGSPSLLVYPDQPGAPTAPPISVVSGIGSPGAVVPPTGASVEAPHDSR